MIEEIRYHHRTRCYAMEQRKRADLSLLSFLRTQLGWWRGLPEQDRDWIAKQAICVVSAGEALLRGKDVALPDHYEDFADIIQASLMARAPFDAVERSATREMTRLSKALPVWPEWAEGINGFGALGLGIIVGEAGDLSNYPKKGHLWKRMGVAVIDGVRQGGLRKTASKEDWIAHGYSPKRRSRMFTIGDAMIKKPGPYREVYLERKVHERERAEAEGLIVVPAAKIPKARAAEYMSDGHIHRRAQRYMEKRFLRDLWQAWPREERAA